MIMGALMTETIATDLHEFSKFINAWSSLFDETTEIKRAEVSKGFFLRMADSYISKGKYAEAIDTTSFSKRYRLILPYYNVRKRWRVF
jgi:hypothetical protein